jgi:hypothetical protein
MYSKRLISSTVIVSLALIIALAVALPALADGVIAVAWLKAQQNADGGFGSPQSAVGATADVLLAVAATGDNALNWAGEEGTTAQAYLEANAGSITKAGETAKVILALIASGLNPRDLGGVDLVAKLEGMVGDEGKIGGENEFINEHCYALIALHSAQRPIPVAAVNYLLARQIEDGTWSWNGDTTLGSGDNNTAAMAVVALVAAGVPADAGAVGAQIQKTLSHFEAQQNEDGGFPYINPSPFGTDSDANSTAVVMWAIKAAGQDPAGIDWKYEGRDGHSALDRLRAFQNDSGAFRWQAGRPGDNFASTVQALIALELKTLPLTTMGVGEGAEDEGAVESAAEAAAGEPEALPETGANLWLQAVVLLGSGAALVGTGLLLRRRS